MKERLFAAAMLFFGGLPPLVAPPPFSPQAPNASRNLSALTPTRQVRYLAFNIFTWGPDPKIAGFSDQGTSLPSEASILATIDDIKTRVGELGRGSTRLAVILTIGRRKKMV